eukprot:4106497-Prorocentrum_lima.AAC.1
MAEQNLIVKDLEGEDVAAQWHKYIQLTSKVVTLGLGQQVPAQLEIEQNDIRESSDSWPQFRKDLHLAGLLPNQAPCPPL